MLVFVEIGFLRHRCTVFNGFKEPWIKNKDWWEKITFIVSRKLQTILSRPWRFFSIYLLFCNNFNCQFSNIFRYLLASYKIKKKSKFYDENRKFRSLNYSEKSFCTYLAIQIFKAFANSPRIFSSFLYHLILFSQPFFHYTPTKILLHKITLTSGETS